MGELVAGASGDCGQLRVSKAMGPRRWELKSVRKLSEPGNGVLFDGQTSDEKAAGSTA